MKNNIRLTTKSERFFYPVLNVLVTFFFIWAPVTFFTQMYYFGGIQFFLEDTWFDKMMLFLTGDYYALVGGFGGMAFFIGNVVVIGLIFIISELIKGCGYWEKRRSYRERLEMEKKYSR